MTTYNKKDKVFQPYASQEYITSKTKEAEICLHLSVMMDITNIYLFIKDEPLKLRGKGKIRSLKITTSDIHKQIKRRTGNINIRHSIIQSKSIIWNNK